VPVGLGRIVAKATHRGRRARTANRASGCRSVALDARGNPAPNTAAVARPFTIAEAALGVLIAGSSSVYFAGDTDCFRDMAQAGGASRRGAAARGRLGSEAWARPSRPGTRGRSGGTYPPGDRLADPLGDPLPARHAASGRPSRFEAPGEAFREAVAARDRRTSRCESCSPANPCSLDRSARR
jgi:hypothetical protein